jgi:heme/copper-type cytochrome/quinol oxidase subunit 2
MTRRSRFGLLALAVVIAIVAFVIAQSGGNDSSKSGANRGSTSKGVVKKPIQIEVKGGMPVGGIRDITVNKGDRVRFSVSSDVADEIHVHGYDFMRDVPAGGTVRFDFPAKIDGSFEIELEKRKEQIASLKVEP